MCGLCVNHILIRENAELPKGAHGTQELLWLWSTAPWRGFVVGRAAGRSKTKLQVNDPAARGSSSPNPQWLG